MPDGRACVNVVPRWWVINDDVLRYALARVESGEVTKEEAYADLCEHATIDQIEPRDD